MHLRLRLTHLRQTLLRLSSLCRHCREQLVKLRIVAFALFNPLHPRRCRSRLEVGKRAAGLTQSASVSPDAARMPDATAIALVMKVCAHVRKL